MRYDHKMSRAVDARCLLHVGMFHSNYGGIDSRVLLLRSILYNLGYSDGLHILVAF